MLFFRPLFLTAVISSILLSPVFASGEGGGIEIKEDEGTFTGSLSPLPRQKPDTKRSGTSSSPRNQEGANTGSSSSSRNRSPSPRREGERSATSVSTVTTQSEAQAPSSAVVLSTQQGHSETDVSDAEWAKIMRLIPFVVSLVRGDIGKESGSQEEPQSAPLQKAMKHQREVFERFHSLYRSLKGQIPGTVREKFVDCFLIPLRGFVCMVELLFKEFRKQYRNQGKDSSVLRRECLPIFQKMFNRMMWAWEQLTGKRAALIGQVDVNVVFNDNKHLFYKRDKNGFLLFYVHPQRAVKLEDNLYRAPILYAPNLDEELTSGLLGGEILTHCIIFSLTGENARAVDSSGFILEREKQGKAFYITPYYGEEADVSYTSGKSLGIVPDDQLARAMQFLRTQLAPLQGNVSQREQNLLSLQAAQKRKRGVDALLKDAFEPQAHRYLLSQLTALQGEVHRLQALVDEDSALEEETQNFAEELGQHIPPSFLRVNTLLASDPLPPQELSPLLLKWVQQELGQQDKCFVRFPRPGVEEQEETYCLLLDIQQRVVKRATTNEDRLLLEYMGTSEQTLEQTIASLEAELLEGYVSDEQRQLEEEWAARKQQVIEEGQAAATKPTGKHAKSNKKKREKKKAATKAETTTTASATGSSVTNTTTASAAAQGSSGLGLTSTSTENQTVQVTTRAKKRLAKLKEEQRKGRPTKYRRFMGLVGLAAQQLKKLGVNVSVTSNKGSHGTLVVDGKDRKDEKEDKKQEGKQEGKSKTTLVRSHGRHDSLHPRGQKGLLNRLVSSFTYQWSSMASAGNTASNR